MTNSNEQNPDQESLSPVTFVVAPEEESMRLDAFLSQRVTQVSRVKIRRAITAGSAKVDGANAKPAYKLKTGQSVWFDPPEVKGDSPEPENIPLDILFEDEHLVAVNKPSAMVVHPAKGHWSGTLTAALAFHFQNLSSIGGATRPGIVHRLDRDTTGVILIAKTDAAHLKLASQFENRTIKKEYFAIVTPAPARDRDLIKKPIGAHPYQREKMAIREGHSTSRDAETFFEVTERFAGFASLLIKPKTGRTHQIRVHLTHIGFPVLADKLYSGRDSVTQKMIERSLPEEVVLGRQALHARQISFVHPESGENMTVEAPLANDIEATLNLLRKYRPA